jgi:hypothetical protein
MIFLTLMTTLSLFSSADISKTPLLINGECVSFSEAPVTHTIDLTLSESAKIAIYADLTEADFVTRELSGDDHGEGWQKRQIFKFYNLKATRISTVTTTDATLLHSLESQAELKNLIFKSAEEISQGSKDCSAFETIKLNLSKTKLIRNQFAVNFSSGFTRYFTIQDAELREKALSLVNPSESK